jgi:hypothetical protein
MLPPCGYLLIPERARKREDAWDVRLVSSPIEAEWHHGRRDTGPVYAGGVFPGLHDVFII